LRAVSNSSVLIALSSIGQLFILTQRFPDGIVIPQAVWYEVVEAGAGQTGSAEVAAGLNTWLSIQEAKNKTLISVLQQDLDQGEAEAIALWLEQPSEALLLDEKKARQVARRMTLPILGTLGLLIWAKRQGVIVNLQEQLDVLQTVAKFRLSQQVYDEALRQVGELQSIQ
jgi:predicted nucleic acid-binding protein